MQLGAQLQAPEGELACECLKGILLEGGKFLAVRPGYRLSFWKESPTCLSREERLCSCQERCNEGSLQEAFKSKRQSANTTERLAAVHLPAIQRVSSLRYNGSLHEKLCHFLLIPFHPGQGQGAGGRGQEGRAQGKGSRVRKQRSQSCTPTASPQAGAQRRSDLGLRGIRKLNDVWCFDELDVFGLSY